MKKFLCSILLSLTILTPMHPMEGQDQIPNPLGYETTEAFVAAVFASKVQLSDEQKMAILARTEKQTIPLFLEKIQNWVKEHPRATKTFKRVVGGIIVVAIVTAGIVVYNYYKTQTPSEECKLTEECKLMPGGYSVCADGQHRYMEINGKCHEITSTGIAFDELPPPSDVTVPQVSEDAEIINPKGTPEQQISSTSGEETPIPTEQQAKSKWWSTSVNELGWRGIRYIVSLATKS